MSKAKRLSRLEDRRVELEAEYFDALVAALQATAAGQWGLFDHNQDKHIRAAAAPMVDNLCDLGEAIDEIRDQLDMEPFALHKEFEASRGPVASHAVGEPKQARAWLEKLKKA